MTIFLQHILLGMRNRSHFISNNFLFQETAISSYFAKRIIIETASVSLLSTVACSYATNFTVSSSIRNYSIATIITNIFLNLFNLKLLNNIDCNEKTSRNIHFNFKKTFEWLISLNFAFFFGTTGNLLIHEFGHVLAASMVYSNLSSQIELTGLFKAVISWYKSDNTMFGNIIGDLNSRLLICIAGPLSATFAGSLGLIAGFYLKELFSEFSRYLILSSIITIAYQVLYALTAMLTSKNDLGHDFVMLWQIGIHPLISSLILTCIPLIVLATYSRFLTILPKDA